MPNTHKHTPGVEEVVEEFRKKFVEGHVGTPPEVGYVVDWLRTAVTNTAHAVREATVTEITHEWNKGELQLDGTTQGAINCIEHFRNYLATLSTKEHEN